MIVLASQVALWVILLVADTLARTLYRRYHRYYTLARPLSVPVQITFGSHRLALAVPGPVFPSLLTRTDTAHVLYVEQHYSRMLMRTMLRVFLQVY